MRTSSRWQSIIDCLEGIQINPAQSASAFLKNYFQKNRAIGSQDRRFIIHHVYALMRSWPRWKALEPSLTIRQAVWHFNKRDSTNFDGSPFAPACINEVEASLIDLPDQGSLEHALLSGRFSSDFWGAMNDEAPWDLRINPLKITRDQAWKKLLKFHPDMTITPWSPWGLRLPSQQKPSGLIKEMLDSGFLEVQDEGSQLIGLLCDAKPGMRIWDACAGAGGKTLILGASMQNSGLLVASDSSMVRLEKAQNRLQRAGLHRVQYQAWPHVKQTFDRVLVDGPCSGTGTWRRHPELAMRFAMPSTDPLQPLLDQASLRVASKGWLVYATCSILKEENQHVVETFLNNHPDFVLKDIASVWRSVLKIPYPNPSEDKWLQLSPLDHYTDGFFIAILERKE